jgi:hypothetical protein
MGFATGREAMVVVRYALWQGEAELRWMVAV